MPILASFECCFSTAYRLQETIELGPIAPSAFKVVELDFAGVHITNYRIPPLVQLDDPTGLRIGKQLGGAEGRFLQLSIGQASPPGSPLDHGPVSEFPQHATSQDSLIRVQDRHDDRHQATAKSYADPIKGYAAVFHVDLAQVRTGFGRRCADQATPLGQPQSTFGKKNRIR